MLDSHRRPKILIVDDDEVLQRTVSRALRKLELEPLSLLQPWRILAVAAKQQPDLLLVNVEVSYHESYLLEELKHDARTRSIPIFMHSRKGTRDHRVLAFELGADEYFGRPIQPDFLALQIANRLRRSDRFSTAPPPRAPLDTVPDLIEIDRQQVETLRAAQDERDSTSTHRTSSCPPAVLRPVLIVEDDNDIRNCLSQILEDEGIPTLTAKNGQEALDILHLEKVAPSVMLLDLMMPVMDGWELRRRIEADSTIPQPAVVVMSAMSPDETIGDAIWLRKPLGVEQLLSTVAQLTAWRPPPSRCRAV